MKTYEIAIEIAGPLAMWARPDTGSTPTSYPVPTWSAAKGIFESIAFFFDGKAWVNPVRVEICKRKGLNSPGEIYFQKYTTNYRGPLQKKTNFQLSALVLSDVCYRIYGTVENGDNQPLEYGDNPCHHLKAMFERRLTKGQCHKTPCLGWNEFTPSYWGPLRTIESGGNIITEVDESISLDMVSLLKKVFDKEVKGKYAPSFSPKARIIKGGFLYD